MSGHFHGLILFQALNEHLTAKTYLLGNTFSLVDVIVFSAVVEQLVRQLICISYVRRPKLQTPQLLFHHTDSSHSWQKHCTIPQRFALGSVSRWLDLVQHQPWRSTSTMIAVPLNSYIIH